MSSGVFTLPLVGIDASGAADGHRVSEDCRVFIAGEENALLRILVDAIFCDRPQYSPITLCGPSGVGKSHLLHGLVNRVRTLTPERKVWFLTGADFARQYARSVELDTLPELREKLLAARVLIVDGLEELSSKPAAQQELIHVIDRSVERESQLLFSCQNNSFQWSWMRTALRSRLEGGLIIPVALPASATRVEIVRQLSAELGMSLTDEIRNLTVSNGPTTSRETFRQLKHALLQLIAHEQSSATEKIAANPLGTEKDVSTSQSIRRITKLVARNFELKFSDLTGSSRRKTVVQARGVAIYLARSFLGVSFDQLGKNFGNRDHTTVLHAYHKTANSLGQDPSLKQIIDRISQELTTHKT